MPERFPFRKLSGEKTNTSQGPHRALGNGLIIEQSSLPVVGESQRALAWDLCLPVTKNQLPFTKLWAARAHLMQAAEGLREEVTAPSCSPLPLPGVTCNHSATSCCQNYLGRLKCAMHIDNTHSAAGRMHQVTDDASISSKSLENIFFLTRRLFGWCLYTAALLNIFIIML